MNKTILMGRLGGVPETKELGEGNSVVNFSVATSRKYFSKKKNEKVEETEWHSCSAFGKTGESIAQYLTKGDPILLEGRIQYRSYEKEGVTAKATNILVDRFEFVAGRVGTGDARNAESQTDGSSLTNHAPQVNTEEPMPF